MATLSLKPINRAFSKRDIVRVKFTEPVSDDLEQQMRDLFMEQPRDGFSLSYEMFTSLIDRLEKIDKKESLIGLAIIPGKGNGKSNFDIAIEGVRYTRVTKKGLIKEYSFLDSTEYFGVASADNFSSVHEGAKGFSEVRDTIKNPDTVKVILVEEDWIITMRTLLVPNADISLVFGRNIQNKKLTMILRGNVSINHLGFTLKLDDHDLIPPPPDEA